jgi:hypothetical protein
MSAELLQALNAALDIPATNHSKSWPGTGPDIASLGGLLVSGFP